MTDIKSAPQSKHHEINPVANDDGLFQQLLQSNKELVNFHEKSPVTKQPFIHDEKESEDLVQNPDMLNMIIAPLEQVVEQPVELIARSAVQNEDNHLHNAVVMIAETKLTNINQQSETTIVDCENDSNQLLIVNEQESPLLISMNENHPLINEITKPVLNSQLDKCDTVVTPSSLPIDTSILEKKEFSHQNIHQNISQITPTNNLPDSHFLASTNNKELMTDTHQFSAFITDNLMQNQLFSPTTSTLQAISLSMPVNISQWQTSLTEQIVMLSRQDIKTAEIKLHPQELGSLHIKLAMHDDKMHLHMMAAHTVVKGVLESALPLLRTSLEEQGITLQQAEVSDFSMMNDSQQQSSMFKQSKNTKQTISILQDEEQQLKQASLDPVLLSSRVSIFA